MWTLTRWYYSVLRLFYGREVNVVVVGLLNSGKTSIGDLITGHEFHADTIPTVGVDYKYLPLDKLLVRILDLSGQQRFQDTLWPQCYQNQADLILFVFDISDTHSLKIARSKLIDIIRETNTIGIPILIIGNKVDLMEDSDFTALPKDIELVGDQVASNNNNNNINKKVEVTAPVNRVECFMQFLGLKQESQDKFLLRRAVSNPSINLVKNQPEAALRKKPSKRLIIEQKEEEITELYRDIGIFLVSCKDNYGVDDVKTWVLGK